MKSKEATGKHLMELSKATLSLVGVAGHSVAAGSNAKNRQANSRTLFAVRACFCILTLGLGLFSSRPAKAQTFGCSPAMANDVVCENSKPGNPSSDWQIGGSGDATIQGFATDISVAQGATISFKINTNAKAYTIGIFRLGTTEAWAQGW